MVEFVGKLSRDQVNKLYGQSRAGLVLYQPAANHYESQPIKMFEFMAAGLPVIASDFPLWREIIEENKCGICVDPQDINAVRNACELLLSDPETAQQMGLNGHKAVEDKYSWDSEAKKLIDIYKSI